MNGLSPIRIGARVYLRNAICGEPGVVMAFERNGNALIEWTDTPEIAKWTIHPVDSLVVDEAFNSSLDPFGEFAA